MFIFRTNMLQKGTFILRSVRRVNPKKRGTTQIWTAVIHRRKKTKFSHQTTDFTVQAAKLFSVSLVFNFIANAQISVHFHSKPPGKCSGQSWTWLQKIIADSKEAKKKNQIENFNELSCTFYFPSYLWTPPTIQRRWKKYIILGCFQLNKQFGHDWVPAHTHTYY